MKTIFSVQHMRGIAALFVVFFHTRWMLNNVYVQKNMGDLLFFEGYFGVDLFFMISGFIIVYATRDKGKSSPFSFIIKRFFRIYPLFLVCFAFAAIIVPHYKNYDFAYLIKSILLIPVDFNQGGPGYGYNLLLVAWTLAYEISFYLIFMLSMCFSHKYRSLICSGAIVFISFSIYMFFNNAISFSGEESLLVPEKNTWYNFLTFISNPMFLNFVVGMIGAEIFSSRLHIDKNIITVILWTSIGFFLYAYFSRNFHGKGLANIGLPCAFIFIGYVLYDKVQSVKPNATLNFLGDISFSLYLSHILVVEFLAKYQIPWDLSWYRYTYGMGRVALYLTITILLSYVLHIAIEKPFVKLGRKLTSKPDKI